MSQDIQEKLSADPIAQMFGLIPPKHPEGDGWFKRWLTTRRHKKLTALLLKYHIVPGPNFWNSKPKDVEREIEYALEHGEPFEFPEYDLPPDSPETAALRDKLREAMEQERI